MHKIGKKTLTLTEYRYATVVNGCIPEFSCTNGTLPLLNYTDLPVPMKMGNGDLMLFEDMETVKNYRYVYAVVESNTEEEVIFSTISHVRYKIWFNGVYIGANLCFDLFAFFLRPQKGKNILVMEICPEWVSQYDFNNQLILRSVEEQQPDSFLRNSCVEYFKRAQLFHSPDARGGILSLICLPRSFAFVDHALLDLIDDFGRTVLQRNIISGEEYRFSTAELLALSPETKRMRLSLEIFFRDGSSVKRNQFSLLRDFGEEPAQLATRWESLKPRADRYTFARIEDQYKKLLVEPLLDTPAEAISLLELRQLLDRIEQDKPPFYREEQHTYVSYLSAMDLSYRRIRISVPDNLTEKPGLLIYFNFSGYGTGYQAIALLDHRSDVIIADLSTAGASIGNAIGESIILEGLEEIKRLYPIDEQRIYFYGYCGNGYTVWSFARNFPHKVAGFTCTESLPAPTGLENFDNARSTTYYWETATAPVVRKLASRPFNKVVRIPRSTHAFMQFYLFKGESYRFLDDPLPKYPDTVRFYTQRIRHNRSFWVTLNNIRKGKSFARVVATVVDPQNIRIRLTNCDDLTLEIPPQMAPSFAVCINGISLHINAADRTTLRFVKDSSWKISTEVSLPLSRKGTGLLDVYYGPMRILRENSAVAAGIAEHFSQPEAMSFSPKLQVQYPVYTHETFPEEECTSNLTLINTDTVCGKKIDFPIKTSKNGYEYQGKTFSGDYCVLQVVPNPFYPERSILQVRSNRLKKFAKHLFLRKVILPSMLTGVSPYWNAEGVILTDDGVTAIQEW